MDRAILITVVRRLRSGIVIWQHAAFLVMLSLLLYIAIVNRDAGNEWEGWFPFFCATVVMPACFANMLNGFVLMVEGQRRLRWKWWMQLSALFLISFPILGYFFWTRTHRQLAK